ncbi:MAG: tol-pal system protein YbgF [Pseudomonadota bacterium]|nr:tol-pal system protein YbgF [Pseudomonadota bacterium]
MMKHWMATAGLMLITIPALAVDDIPVEDYSEPAYESARPAVTYQTRNYQDSNTDRLSMPERVQRVENKVENLTSLNLQAKVEELQQTIQELRGQLEKQSHDLETLTAQQKSFYADLSGRLAKPVQPSEGAACSTSAPATAAAPAAVPAPGLKTSSNVDPDQGSNNDEHQAYRQAFALLKSKQYDQALKQFQAYLKNYPKGHYTVNAYYWVGEMNYLLGNQKEAKKAFDKVVNLYPGNEKIPDALLKLAIIDIELGHKQKAAAMLAQIQQKYPGTSAARLAMMRTQELKVSKH